MDGAGAVYLPQLGLGSCGSPGGTLLLSPISPLQDLSLAEWVSEGRSAWPLHTLPFALLLCGHLSRLPNIRTLNSEIAQLSAEEWSD